MGELSFGKSAAAIAEAGKWIAGGVNSHFRIGMAPGPLVFTHGDGPYLLRCRWQPADRLLLRHGRDGAGPQARPACARR